MSMDELWPVCRHILVTAILMFTLWDAAREKKKPKRKLETNRKDVVLDAEYETVD